MSKDAPVSLPTRLYPHRFTILLAALVVNLLLAPVLVSFSGLQDSAFGGGLSLASLVVLMLAAALAVSHKRSTTLGTLALAAGALLAEGLEYATGSGAALFAHHILDALFLLVVTALLIRHVFTQPRVTLNLINAALCAYLILGLMCAAGFAVIEIARPGSFHLPEDGMGPFAPAGFQVDEAARRIYFSFVTLLTLGYGDMFPLNSIARLATVMEAFVGQIMLVVLVARLVGVQVAQSMEALNRIGGSSGELTK